MRKMEAHVAMQKNGAQLREPHGQSQCVKMLHRNRVPNQMWWQKCDELTYSYRLHKWRHLLHPEHTLSYSGLAGKTNVWATDILFCRCRRDHTWKYLLGVSPLQTWPHLKLRGREITALRCEMHNFDGFKAKFAWAAQFAQKVVLSRRRQTEPAGRLFSLQLHSPRQRNVARDDTESSFLAGC